MDDDQIWAQLDLRMKPVCDMLELALDADPSQEEELDNSDTDEFVDEQLLRQMRALESGEDGMDEMEVDDIDFDNEEEESEEAESEEESDDDVDLGEDVAVLRDPSSDDGSEPEADGEWPASLRKRPSQSKSSAGSKAGLDDGFFDLASFNAETEEAEARKVSRGRLDEDDSSDDESIDLFAPVDVAENFDEEDEDTAGGECSSGDKPKKTNGIHRSILQRLLRAASTRRSTATEKDDFIPTESWHCSISRGS
jgi:U3 small nucleolar RNA-associated protein MPP10